MTATLVTTALAPDPIFAAIEAHKAACEHVLAQADGSETLSEAFTAEDDIAMALLDVEPTTRAGVVALLEYFAESEAKDGGMWPDRLFDEDNPNIHKEWGTSFGYFVARNAAKALAKM